MLNLNGFSVKIFFHIRYKPFFNFFICICKITCKPMGNFAENLNLGNRFRPPLSLRVIDIAPSIVNRAMCQFTKTNRQRVNSQTQLTKKHSLSHNYH